MLPSRLPLRLLPPRSSPLVAALGLVLALALLVAPQPALARAPKKPAAAPRLFDSPVEAMQAVLAGPGPGPRVLGLGEVHEIEGGPKVRSSLVHFRDELLPMLAPLSSDLVLETWVTEGNCGKAEQAVVGQVEQTTQRPETVETDLVKLVKRSRALAVTPHILQVSCAEYRALLDDKGEVDYEKLLAAIARLLEKKVDAIRKERGPREVRSVLVYGGSVHNELDPPRELRPFTYAPSLAKKTRNGVVSVNLFVPEFLERNEYLKAQPWYAQLAGLPADKTVLLQRGPRSYVIVFPRGVPVEAAPAPPAAAVPAAR